MKVFLLITGAKIKAYANLKKLCKDNGGIDHKFIRQNLPFQSGNLRIEEVEVNEELF